MIDETTLDLITQDFANMKSSVTQILGVAVPAIVGIITFSFHPRDFLYIHVSRPRAPGCF